METLTRQVAWAFLSLLAAASSAAGATIEGQIEGWSPLLRPAQPTVVWLEGAGIFRKGKVRPVMAQRGGQFAPSFLVVVAGETVEMPNEDDVAHNVYSVSDAKSFNLGYYAKGERKSVTFERPGMVDTLCVLHSFMRARILVVPNPYYAMVVPDGSFRIRNVPAGHFTLSGWRDGLKPFHLEFTVPEGSVSLPIRVPLPQTTSGK